MAADPRGSNFKRKSKYQKRPVTFPDMQFKGHFLNGYIWPYVNSKGTVYETELTDKGFTCDCPGFSFHGKCKHITIVHEKLVA